MYRGLVQVFVTGHPSNYYLLLSNPYIEFGLVKTVYTVAQVPLSVMSKAVLCSRKLWGQVSSIMSLILVIGLV